ncbi:odorant receptor 85c-like [Onthophagus taurus]|uniref:odorant receptor 85c-like n=1 Tax=Onthophagus taurus TaxID=166361 RepID=UPI000C1FF6C5|nr:odorant receptor 85b-like [Onthophagus taurus]
MVDESKYQFMGFTVKVLKMLNIWLNDGEIDELKWRSWKTYSIYIFLIPSVLPLFIELIFIFTEPEADIVIIFQVVLAGVCVAGSMYMTLCFLSNRKGIKEIIKSIELFTKYSDLDIIAIDLKISFYSKIFIFYTITGILIYVIAPTLHVETCEATKPRYMKEAGIPCGVIVRIRLPYRYDKSPMFEIYVIHQFLTAAMSSLVIVNSTILICGLLRHVELQFKKLFSYIMLISTVKTSKLSETVKFCVEYHHEIIKFVENINLSFGSQLVVHVTLTSLVISILGFEILMEDDLFESVRYGMHLSGWLLLLFTICHFGQNLMDESTSLAIAAYNTPWYNSPVSIQKDILLILIRSQKPLTLNAMNLGDLSRATFLKVLSSAYSYFTLFLNVKK